MNARIIVNALSVLLIAAAAANAGPLPSNLSASSPSKLPAAKPMTALSVQIIAPDGVDTSNLLVLVDANGGLHQEGLTGKDGRIYFKPVPEGTYRIMVCGPAGFAGGMYQVKGGKLEIVIKVDAPSDK